MSFSSWIIKRWLNNDIHHLTYYRFEYNYTIDDCIDILKKHNNFKVVYTSHQINNNVHILAIEYILLNVLYIYLVIIRVNLDRIKNYDN